ncbi:MAG: hypothetical protein AAFZ09_12750, partial [Pseudomonadota bacterium]
SGIHRNTIGKIDKGGRVRIGIVHKLLESLHERSPPYYKPILAAEAQALGLDLTALSEGEQKTEDLLEVCRRNLLTIHSRMAREGEFFHRSAKFRELLVIMSNIEERHKEIRDSFKTDLY